MKTINTIEIKKSKEIFDLIIRTENSVQSIVLTGGQLAQLEKEIVKFNMIKGII